MATETAFWDTSAIIPLCCIQDASATARVVRRRYPQSYIWWGTVVEIHSGIARLVRTGQLAEDVTDRALLKWRTFRAGSRIVRPSEIVLNLATLLPQRHSLKAMDSFQLAAALEWCKERPRNRPFVCSDNRLSEAAAAAGFDVVSLV